jgi:hypothetical protein
VNFTCDPQGASPDRYYELVRQNNGDPDTFGITIFDTANFQGPAISLDSRGRLEPTQTSMHVPSFFIQAGSVFPDPQGRQPTNRDEGVYCDNYTIHYRITTSGAAKIAEGEQEHCSDFRRAFDLTVGSYTSAINRLAARRTRFANEAQAIRRLERMTGIPFDQLSDKLDCLVHKSVLRDTRRMHEPISSGASYFPTARHCRYPVLNIEGTHFPQIGTRDSASLITGCDVPGA